MANGNTIAPGVGAAVGNNAASAVSSNASSVTNGSTGNGKASSHF